jgi:hypothetical protein
MQRGQILRSVIGLVSISWCLAAVAQIPSTTRERESLSEKAANRMVQRDLLSVFEPVKQIDSGMFRQLRGIDLTTKAFGTEFEGLCRRDAITLWYSATEKSAEPEDVPVQPYSVEAQPWFHILKLPRSEPGDKYAENRIWSVKCRSAGRSEDVSWFAAKDARTAVQGALVLEAALIAVRSGALKAQACPEIFDAKKFTCEEAILAESEVSKIDSVEACASNATDLCYIIDLNSSTKLTIKGRASGNALAPEAVTSIAIEQYIIVT